MTTFHILLASGGAATVTIAANRHRKGNNFVEFLDANESPVASIIFRSDIDTINNGDTDSCRQEAPDRRLDPDL